MKADDNPSLVWTLSLGCIVISWHVGLRVISKYTTFEWSDSEKACLSELVNFCSSLSATGQHLLSWEMSNPGQRDKAHTVLIYFLQPGHTQITLGRVIVPHAWCQATSEHLMVLCLWEWTSVRTRALLSLEEVRNAKSLS